MQPTHASRRLPFILYTPKIATLVDDVSVEWSFASACATLAFPPLLSLVTAGIKIWDGFTSPLRHGTRAEVGTSLSLEVGGFRRVIGLSSRGTLNTLLAASRASKL